MVYYKHHLAEPIRLQRKDFSFNYYRNFSLRSFHKTLASFDNGWVIMAPLSLVEWNEE